MAGLISTLFLFVWAADSLSSQAFSVNAFRWRIRNELKISLGTMTQNASAARNNEAQGLDKQLSISNKVTAKWGRRRRGTSPRVILHVLQKFSPNSHWLVLNRSRLLSLRLLLIVGLWKRSTTQEDFAAMVLHLINSKPLWDIEEFITGWNFVLYWVNVASEVFFTSLVFLRNQLYCPVLWLAFS